MVLQPNVEETLSPDSTLTLWTNSKYLEQAFESLYEWGPWIPW